MRMATRTVLTIAVWLCVSAASAAPSYRLTLAHVIAAGTPIDVAAQRFATLVGERSGGALEVRVSPAGRLGGERTLIEGVQLGRIDMSFTTTGAIGGFVPEFQVLDLPYLFPGYEAAYTFLDGEPGRRLLDLLDRRGMHGVVYLENGWRNFTSSRRPLRRPADLEGQRIRVMESPMYMGLVHALKARPTPMAYSELTEALAARVVDGQENPSVNVYSARMYESQAYMIRDRHTYNVFILKVNGKLWVRLPATLRKIIEDTAAEVRDFQRKLNRETDDDFVRKLRAKGMDIHEPTAGELDAWKAATAGLYDDARKIVGAAWVDTALRFRADWEAGRYREREQEYVQSYRRIEVPVGEVMKNFR